MFLSSKYTLQGHTCGDHCWSARDEECKCSCGGANHGIFRKEGTRPTRTRKMDGAIFELCEIGDFSKLYASANAANSEDKIFNRTGWKWGGKRPRFEVRGASESQRKWPEIQPFLGERDLGILWKRISAHSWDNVTE